MRTVLDSLEASLRQTGSNGGDQHRPAAVLWPDPEALWTDVIEELGERLNVLTMGDYAPVSRSGPAYWIRCALAGEIDGIAPGEQPPVIYLPGVSREEFRAAEDCPESLKPLVELQYRGVFWSQPNGKDWTPLAFLKNRDRGLGVEVASDSATGEALTATLSVLLQQPVEWLERKPLITAAVLNSLVQPDPVKTLLEWLSDPTATFSRLSSAEWSAFKASCTSEYGFDPAKDGEIRAASLFAGRTGAWKTVWLRFREAPSLYPGVEDQLRKAAPSSQGTLALEDESSQYEQRDVWPQHNDESETQLRKELNGTRLNAEQARSRILELEREHGVRRLWVWADLGRAPLAIALQHLARLAENVESPPSGSVAAIADWYRLTGWIADDAAMKALGSVRELSDTSAVENAVTLLYSGWLDETALRFQEAVESDPGSYASPEPSDCQPGTCLLFTDGLRYDLAVGLSELLRGRGLTVELGSHLAALPTITSTAKPALAPIAGAFFGGPALAPVTEAGTEVGVAQMRATLTEAGYLVLDASEKGDPAKRAWTEFGNIDKHGHNFGARMADAVEAELAQIAGRVQMLLDAGWQQVEVVTDHGFLLLPGALRKVELKEHLVAKRKGRCARLTEHQDVKQPTVAWRWDDSVRFAVARGAACFEDGKTYEHGGLSPQECVVPHLVVRAAVTAGQVAITVVGWSGLRLRVEISGSAASLDLRTRPADAASSLFGGMVPMDGARASAVVPEPEAEGSAAVIVLLSANGELLAQQPTIVGAL